MKLITTLMEDSNQYMNVDTPQFYYIMDILYMMQNRIL